MKIKRAIITTIVLFSIFAICPSHFTLALTTGFETEDMDEDSQESRLEFMQIKLLTSGDEQTKSIKCFDINEKGMIALGLYSSDDKAIYVYNPKGEFEYGYAFMDYGDFGVEWDHDNLLICSARGDVITAVDRDANCVDMKRITDSIGNNTYWNHEIFAAKRTYSADTYEIRNDLGFLNAFATSKSRLVKIDCKGKTTVLYDVSGNTQTRIIIVLCGVVIFLTIVIITIVKQVKKLSAKQNGSS